MLVRITEIVTTNTEVSYDAEVPDHVYHESKGESVEDHRDKWVEINREIVSNRRDIIGVEAYSYSPE